MKRPVVGLFASQLSGGVPRGAMRLFSAIATELSSRDDLEVVALGDFVSESSDPTGCTFVRHNARDWLHFGGGTANAHSPLDGLIEQQKGRQNNRIEQQTGQRAKAPTLFRWKREFRRIIRKIRRVLSRLTHRRIEEAKVVKSESLAPELPLREQQNGPEFTNDDILEKLISLEQIDVLIDFWWFHLAERSPILHRYRPKHLRVIGWFLDAIPLRTPPWTPGQIPPHEFRSVLQPHLETFDEIVAISACGADDARAFFPHIACKPIHVIPCGIYSEDFVAPHGSEFVQRQFGIDLRRPVFAFIGALEPAKNLSNCLRALTEVATVVDQNLQVLILGAIQNTDLAAIMGPYLPPLLARTKVVVTGMVSEAVKRAILSNSSVLIYASKWEGFGIPPLEAMAAGLQVVASDIPTAHENYGGLAELCDPHDVRSIADAILRTLRKGPDEVALWRAQARAHAQQYMWGAAADQLADVIRNSDSAFADGHSFAANAISGPISASPPVSTEKTTPQRA
jgi:glycosyltransferase involved in cell wall biosynthesis